ncbi:MAG: ketoacyl-ACP synthase III [Clostridiales bacterium]|jgi:3-oxoacyl-[acyl-carrier-protein] synthase-3|nr:ketoacyl-ACP synthase III [Clostridiales bacterium]
MYSAIITGVGMYVPDNLVTNADLAEEYGRPLKPSLEAKVGIFQRYIAGSDESTADLATKAGERAIADAGLKPEDIGLVIVATDTPEYITPATSFVVQGRLNAVNAGAFDINASCSGFVSAMNAACRMVMTGGYGHILVIGAYNMTKYADRSNYALFPIFADGAGAAVISRSEKGGGFVGSKLHADGTQFDLMGIYAGGTKYPMTRERFDRKEHMLQSLKPLPPDRNVQLWPPIIETLVKENGLRVKDIDFIFFTQINRWIIDTVMPILGLPMEKTICIMDRYGYTGSACIPMALRAALDGKRLKRGDNVVFIASGVGLGVASILYKWV